MERRQIIAFAWEVFEDFRKTVMGSRRGIKDVLILMTPQVVIVLTGFVTAILLARGLGPTALGKYALVLSISGVATALSDLGIGQTAIRYASRAISTGRQEDQFAILRWAFRLRMALVLIVTVAFALLAPILAGSIWHSPDLTDLLRIGLISGIFTALASIPSSYFQSTKEFTKNARVQIGQALISLGGILILAWLGLWSVELVLVVAIFASALGAAVFIAMVPRSAIVSLVDFKTGISSILRPSWKTSPLDGSTATDVQDASPSTFAFFNLVSTVLILIILRVDVWFMGFFLDQSQVGIYNVASRFVIPLTILLSAINGALWPRASAQLNPGQTASLLPKTLHLSIPVGLLCVVYAIGCPMLAPLLFGHAYDASVLLAQLLSIRYAFAIMISPFGILGYSLGLVRIYWIVNIIQLAAVVAVNILLVPRIGPLGSAFALIVNESIGALIVGWIVWRKIAKIHHREQV